MAGLAWKDVQTPVQARKQRGESCESCRFLRFEVVRTAHGVWLNHGWSVGSLPYRSEVEKLSAIARVLQRPLAIRKLAVPGHGGGLAG